MAKKKTWADKLVEKEWKLVVSFLHHTGGHNRILTQPEVNAVWVLADGFGKQDLAFIAETEYDWSHVRDSSSTAVLEMGQKIRDLLAQRAHPGHQFCAKCLDSGLHLPEGR